MCLLLGMSGGKYYHLCFSYSHLGASADDRKEHVDAVVGLPGDFPCLGNIWVKSPVK